MQKYVLETTVFVCGAVVMVFEIVGSRVLGPYFGTSVFVWTSLIGVVLGSLSLGYWLGGDIADRSPSKMKIAMVIFCAGLAIGVMALTESFFLGFLSSQVTDIRFASVVASVVLFAPTSILLGMITPLATKLKIVNMDTTGSVIGNLAAIATLGNIGGTFFAGFFLIPYIGTQTLLLFLSLFLLVFSVFLTPKNTLRKQMLFGTALLGGLFIFDGFDWKKTSEHIERIDVDTAYNRIWIYDRFDPVAQKKIRIMGINNENHSSMFLQSDELANDYTRYYDLVQHFYPQFKTALMFGGAGYSYPKHFLMKYPDAAIDVVEIDPMVTQLAEKYFRLKKHPRLSIFHEDGRVYLNTTKKKYDVLFGDAFGSYYSIPYQLTTREAIQRQYDILSDQGIVILNMVSAVTGKQGLFLRAEYATYRSIFPQIHLFLVDDPADGSATQNIMLVALKSSTPSLLTHSDQYLNAYLQHRWTQPIEQDVPLLTDDFAPVEYYMSKAI